MLNFENFVNDKINNEKLLLEMSGDAYADLDKEQIKSLKSIMEKIKKLAPSVEFFETYTSRSLKPIIKVLENNKVNGKVVETLLKLRFYIIKKYHLGNESVLNDLDIFISNLFTLRDFMSFFSMLAIENSPDLINSPIYTKAVEKYNIGLSKGF
jgi:hypothetical protein